MSKKNKQAKSEQAKVESVVKATAPAPVAVAPKAIEPTPAPKAEAKPVEVGPANLDAKSGKVLVARKQAVATYIPKGETKPFGIGDQVRYFGQVKKNRGKLGTITGKNDDFGFTLKYEDGATGTSIPGALVLVKRAEPKPAESKTETPTAPASK